MIIDDTTPALGLPLPHPENLLDDDVLRLRGALFGVDSELARPRSVSFSRDADGRLTGVTEQLDIGLRTTTLLRQGGQLAGVVINFAGKRTSMTYQRNAGGQISGYTMEETLL